ncbi:hypothetical protein BTW14_gp173 [BeAn 58058 virus]|nr:hypothetical protein BTW14_gp173 [BeAn 58058 virus]APG58364.1 hypothetical protein BAV00187 [BeAn 58058 virus]
MSLYNYISSKLVHIRFIRNLLNNDIDFMNIKKI